MEKNKTQRLREIVSNTLFLILDYFFWFILTSIIFDLFAEKIKVLDILLVINNYINLVVVSWPASILIITLVVLQKHHEAIDHFIKYRMTELGPGGVKGEQIKLKDATESEIKQERIKETKEDDRVINSLIVNSKSEVLENTPRVPVPNTTNEGVAHRYLKISQIEEIVQTSLIDKYSERYKSQVKVTNQGKSLILDGILYPKVGKSPIAIEIKYMSSKRYEVIKFIIARKRTQLASLGISKLVLILVGDNITQEEALRVQEENLHQAKIFFYNWDGNSIKEVEISSRNKHIF